MHQLELFKEEQLNIKGLQYIDNYISREYEKSLIEFIDEQEWSAVLKRRVQHYGYQYQYNNATSEQCKPLGEMPHWLRELNADISNKLLFVFNQVIVNEYLPSQGISPHIDNEKFFGNTICSLSLGSGCIMKFTKEAEVKEIFLKPRSLLILQNDARYKWKHCIPQRKTDKLTNTLYRRGRRISLTFRLYQFP